MKAILGAGSVAGGMATGEAGGGEAGRPSAHGGAWPAERGERGDRVWVREYEDGRLLREDELGAEELEAAFGPLSQRASRHTRRRRRVREAPWPCTPFSLRTCVLLGQRCAEMRTASWQQ